MNLKSIANDKHKMDLYSDMQVPFEVAVWARAHRFNTTAIGITRSLLRRNQLTAEMDRIEKEREEVEAELRAMCVEAQSKMEK